jgi:hypothetical protein
MRWLIRAIGRVLGITQTATLACQTQDGQIGGNNNTAEQPQPVSKESKPKRKAVKAAILAPLPTTETLCVPTRTKKSSTTGTSRVTPARQPAKPKRKPAAKAAPSTTQVKSRKPAQKAAQATRGATGPQSKPTARKTRQHVK